MPGEAAASIQAFTENRSYDDALQVLFDAKRRLGEDRDSARMLEAQEEVYEEYQPYFAPGRIREIREHEILSFLQYENNRHWTGLTRSQGKIIQDMEALREGLACLVDEDRPLAPRFTEALDRVYGMGTAIATAILHVAYPDMYGIWNGTSKGGMKRLDLWPDFKRGVTVGEKYEQINAILRQLAEDLDIDLWTLDGLWWQLPDESEEAADDAKLPQTSEQRAQFSLEQHLQEFLRDNWDDTALGKEWELFADETGPEAGYEYQTKVGRIDLLAKHREEPRWCVIELKRGQTSDETLGQVLRYMGAVRHELAEDEGKVEGLIIAHDMTDRLRYALSMVPSVQLKRYEVDFQLLDVEEE